MTLRSVLVVDDSPSDTLIARFMIEEAGIADHIFEAANGEEALQYIKSSDQTPAAKALPPSLILLDINMPRMNGFEFLEHCAEREMLSDCTILVMLTSSDDSGDIARAKETGLVSAYMTKPVTSESLKALIGGLETSDGASDHA